MHILTLATVPPPPPNKVNPLNAELNPICHLLAFFGAHPILHVSKIRVNYTENGGGQG